jgi:Ca-activated chloride channel family protein
MKPTIVVYTDEEMERWTAVDEEPGFGALLTDRGPLPLKALDVQARLEGLVGEVSLAQTFVNTHAEPLEATYIFPLPDRAAVTHFRLEVAGRVVEGVLKERAAARREYEQALQAGHRAAITEEERPNVFTMRVGNLPAGEAATVRLTLAGPLVYDNGEVTFRFPLVVAPRYIPGTPLTGRSVGDGTVVDTDAVPDASRISPPVLLPGYPNPVRLSLSVDVHSTGLPVQNLRSSLHAVIAEQAQNGTMHITVQPGERLNRDFILRYQLGAEAIQTSLTLVPDAAAPGEGTYVLTVVPPNATASVCRPSEQKPRDVVFVLDRSGSMGGWKMVAARRALGRMVDALTEADRFAVVAFDDRMETPGMASAELMPATDRQRFRTIEWLAKIDARGGTEMAQPLDWAVQQLKGQRDRVLVLVTDGQVGNEDQILNMLGKRLQGIRIFTLGIDRAVNEAFLKRLAALGGGSCDVVESEDRLDEVMAKVQRRIGTPLLTGLRFEAGGMRVESDAQVPGRLPDLFAGVPLQIMGRYRGTAEGSVVLQATDDTGRAVKQTVVGRVGRCPALAAVWARGRLRDLEDRWVVGAQEAPTELEKKIAALSLKFGVLCRFTAFVAVDRSEVVNEGGRQQHLVQPVEAVEGWEMRELQAGVYAVRSLACAAPMAPEMRAKANTRGGMLRGLDSARRLDEADLGDMASTACGVPLEEALESPPISGRAQYPAQEAEDADEPERTQGGIFRRMLRKLRPAKAKKQRANQQTEELAAYRQRARELLEALRADADRGHGLGVLSIKLAALVEDLRSTGAGASVLGPLDKLLVQLRQLLGHPGAPAADVDASWHQAETVLAAFAGAPAGV